MISRPRGLKLLITLALLIALPVTEIWLLIRLGGLIGAFPTVGLVFVQAVVGGWLLKREAGSAWASMNDAIRAGETPTKQLADTGVVVIGGLALMFPGLMTDVLGLLCLIPATRPLPRKALSAWTDRRIARLRDLSSGPGMPFPGVGGFGPPGTGRAGPGHGSGGDVVPGEVVNDPPDTDATSGNTAAGEPRKRSADEDVVIRGELDD